MSAWYIAHDDELLMDLDEAWKLHPSGRTYAELYCVHRLLDAEEQGKLKLHKQFGAFFVESFTPGHIHCYVRLAGPMALDLRLAWQAWLGGDWMRSRADFMRAAMGFPFPSILEEPEPIRGFYREPDRMCGKPLGDNCEGKHKSEAQPDCEVWRKLRGASVWDLFGQWEKPEKLPRLPLAVGPLDLEKFRRLRASKRKP